MPAATPDYSSMSTEALAKLAHNAATGTYVPAYTLMTVSLIVAEIAKRLAAAETAHREIA